MEERMYLGDFSQNANAAERTRRRIQFRGVVPSGDAVWTPAEDDLCRQYGNDYNVLRKKLPHRSYAALRYRCQRLGLRPKRRLVTTSELSRLRRLAPTASPEQLREAFPGRSLNQIRRVSRYYGILRKRQPFSRTGFPVIDAIRERCFELGYSMGDLDELAKTKAYFAKAGWQIGRPNYQAIGRAVAALDGELHVHWRDQE